MFSSDHRERRFGNRAVARFRLRAVPSLGFRRDSALDVTDFIADPPFAMLARIGLQHFPEPRNRPAPVAFPPASEPAKIVGIFGLAVVPGRRSQSLRPVDGRASDSFRPNNATRDRLRTP